MIKYITAISPMKPKQPGRPIAGAKHEITKVARSTVQQVEKMKAANRAYNPRNDSA